MESTRKPFFTTGDVGETVEIEGNELKVGGNSKTVTWSDATFRAAHSDCKGTIKAVEQKLQGKVQLVNVNQECQLQNSSEFENWFENPVDGACKLHLNSKGLKGNIPSTIANLTCKDRITAMYSPASAS